MEEWRQIRGYKDQYEVSNMGRVRSMDQIRIVNRPSKYTGRKYRHRFYRSQIIIPMTDYRRNTLEVRLFKGNRKIGFHYVHQLVAQEWVEKKNPLDFTIRHKDGDKQNCRADNLEWYTPVYKIAELSRGKRKPKKYFL